MTSLSSSNFDQTSNSSSPLASSLPSHSGDDSLATILQSAKERLINFSSSDAAVDQMVSLFENAKVADVEFLLSSWSSGDFSTLPTFAVLEDANMRGAQGAFASESNTVYLSDRLTQQQADQFLDPLTGAVGVAIEEIGHSVDDLLNPAGDTAGDEGELFKAVVLGWVLSDEEKVAIAQEDDTGTIIVNNRSVMVEQAVRRGNSANNTVKGTSSRDYLYGKDGNDKLYGYSGDDKLYGGRNDDKLYGGSGNDYLSGWSGNDYLSGWSGDDRLYGGSGNDHLNGGSGNDRLYGYTGKDKLYGSYGDDRLYGSSGDDLLYGGSGNDKLYGGTNNDYLSGWSGNDYLSGWSGNDILKGYGNGTNERDTLRGGSGNDTFLLGDVEGAYYSKNGSADYATLVDLEPANDTVQLHKFNNTTYSTSRAYGYRLQVVGEDTWLRRDSDGQAIALIEGQTNLNLLSDTFSYVGKADLFTTSTSIPNVVNLGDSITVRSTTKNQGAGIAAAHTIKYWLSNNTTLDSADRLLGTDNIGELTAGDAENNSFTFSYDSTWGAGYKYVLLQTDDTNNIEENDESNNIAYKGFNIATPTPDLVISSFSSPSAITAGNRVNLNAYTKNQGTKFSSGNSVRFWLSNDNSLDTSTDVLLGFKNVGALSANSVQNQFFSFDYNMSWGTGRKYLIAQADGYDIVSESYENNNTASRAINVSAPNPDLVVQSQSAPSTVTVGNTVNISARTKNNSNAVTAGSSRLRYWLSDNTILNTSTDRYLGSDVVSALAAGSSEYDNFSFTYNQSWGTGAKYILFQADGLNNVAETNENNNIAYRAINVQQPKPDLYFSTIIGSSAVTAGETVSVDAYVKNYSTLATAGSSQVRYWLSDDSTLNTSADRYLGNDVVGSLAAGSSEKESFSFVYNTAWGSGSKYLIFQSDALSQVAESNESNNIFAKKMTVAAPKSDLIINGTYGASAVIGGQSVSVGSYIKNNSTLAAAGSSQVRYWLSDDKTLNTSTDRYLGFDTVGALAQGRSESDSINFTYNAGWGTGQKYILFQADALNAVSESHESNNVAYRSIFVKQPSKADLVVQNQIAPSTVETGSSVSVSAYVKNIGNASASQNSQLKYWLSDNKTLDSQDRYLGLDYVSSLSAGRSERETFNFTYNAGWGTGQKYILFQADASNAVSESHESNNVAYKAINVSSKPDLKKYWFYYNFNPDNYELADSYQGSVIAPEGKYTVGQKFDISNQTTEIGRNGSYYISAVEDYNDNLTNESGRVFVDSYHDFESIGSRKTYTPHKYKNGVQPAGFNYLGSEEDFIDSSGSGRARFGKDYYEANPAESRKPDIDIQVDYFGNFSTLQRQKINQAVQNWESIITQDMVHEGVLKIAVTQGQQRRDGTAWGFVWGTALLPSPVTPGVRHNSNIPGYDGINGQDYHNRIHFNSTKMADSNWVNQYLTRLATHEIGHTLYLDEAQNDPLLGLDGVMDLYGLDPNITSGIYSRLESLGYGVNRNAQVTWL